MRLVGVDRDTVSAGSVDAVSGAVGSDFPAAFTATTRYAYVVPGRTAESAKAVTEPSTFTMAAKRATHDPLATTQRSMTNQSCPTGFVGSPPDCHDTLTFFDDSPFA